MSLQNETQCLVSPIERYANYLKGYYKRSKILPEHDKWLPFLNKKFQFINLAVVEKEELDPATADEFTRATFHHGRIDVILKKKKPIQLEDLLRPEEGEEGNKVFLVEGAPGIGKSTMSWELCRQWDNFETLKRFSLIILFRLREKYVQEATTIAELVYHDDPQLQTEVVGHLLASEGVGTLLIFDGFDEICGTCSKLLADIMDGRKLSKSTVIITSRPSARAKLLSLCRALEMFKHVEVLGFTPTKIKEYASSVLESNPSLLSDFTKYIESNPAIRGLMYVPLNCCMVVEIYRERRRGGCVQPVPRTMTQLYEELCLTLLRKYLVDTGAERDDSLPHELDSLPEHVLTQLLALGKMALEGVVKQEVIFDHLPEDCGTLGFVNISTELYIGRRKSYNFHHLTLQEFVAAFYICKLSASEQKRIFSENCKVKHMDIVWRFVAGLSSMQGIGWDTVKHITGLDQKNRVLPFLVQCLYESQEKVDIHTVLGEEEVTFLSDSATPLDCYAVGYCIASSHCAWSLNLGHELGGEVVEMFTYGLTSRSVINGTIVKLVFEGSTIDVKGMACLNGVPKKAVENIECLNFVACFLFQGSRFLDSLLDFISSVNRLTDFNIAFNMFWGLGKIINCLSCLSHLHTLNAMGSTLIPTDIHALSVLIRPSGPLRKLSIGHNEMSVDCVEMMMKTVLSASSLQDLTIYNVSFITGTTFHYLETNHCITTLSLIDCSLSRTGHSLLFKSLCNNTSLERLFSDCTLHPGFDDGDSDNYGVGHEGALALVEMIKANHALKEINIASDNSLGRDDIDAVIATLSQHNCSLQALKLSEDYLKLFSFDSVDSRVMWRNRYSSTL